MMKGVSNHKARITITLSNSDTLNALVTQNMDKDYMSDTNSRKAILAQIELCKIYHKVCYRTLKLDL